MHQNEFYKAIDLQIGSREKWDLASILDDDFKRIYMNNAPSFPIELAPYLINQAELNKIAYLSTCISKAISLASDMMKNSDILPALLRPSGVVFQSSRPETFLIRSDIVTESSSGERKIIEVNASDPSGLGLLSSIDVYAQRIFRSKIPFKPILCLRKLSDSIQGLFNHEDLSIALTQSQFSPVIFDFACLGQALRNMNIPSRFLKSEDLPQADLNRNEILWRDSTDDFLDDSVKNVVSLRAESIINPLGADHLDSKGLIAIFSNPKFLDHLDRKTRISIKKATPFTFFLSEKLVFTGESWVSPWELLAHNKEKYILKPLVGYGGQGIVAGLHSSDNEWNEALRSAKTGPGQWIGQEYIESNPQFVARSTRRKIDFEKQNIVEGIWSIKGQFLGILMRYSKNKIINALTGATFASTATIG